MPFKTQRQKRYQKLIDNGFTKSEAFPLSKISLSSTPYLNDLLRFRRSQIKEWQKSGIRTKEQITQQIREWYASKNLTKKAKAGLFEGRDLGDAWKLLRFAEKEFGAKYPSYTSPFRRKRRDFIPFVGR